MSNKDEFTPIKLIRAIRNNATDANYLVYKNSSEHVAIKANSVFEAIIQSGIEEPFKVIPISTSVNHFLEEEDLKFVVDNSASVNSSSVAPDPSKQSDKSDENKDDQK